jgi:hypothetical protein
LWGRVGLVGFAAVSTFVHQPDRSKNRKRIWFSKFPGVSFFSEWCIKTHVHEKYICVKKMWLHTCTSVACIYVTFAIHALAPSSEPDKDRLSSQTACGLGRPPPRSQSHRRPSWREQNKDEGGSEIGRVNIVWGRVGLFGTPQ